MDFAHQYKHNTKMVKKKKSPLIKKDMPTVHFLLLFELPITEIPFSTLTGKEDDGTNLDCEDSLQIERQSSLRLLLLSHKRGQLFVLVWFFGFGWGFTESKRNSSILFLC